MLHIVKDKMRILNQMSLVRRDSGMKYIHCNLFQLISEREKSRSKSEQRVVTLEIVGQLLPYLNFDHRLLIKLWKFQLFI